MAFFAVASLATIGCGRSDGPQRYRVSGAVTFDGKPVPRGTVTLEPDRSQGNRGPAGYADIIDGRYKTHLGAVGGPHVVKIVEAKMTTSESEKSELFSEYTTTHDLPRKNCVVDFNVPATAPRR
jgi:hypothetical protein